MKLEDFCNINPIVQLNRNEEYEFIEMADIIPNTRYVFSKAKKNFNGSYSKFSNKDTLMAKITPCLENGKISQYIGDDKAFGSTEFNIFREKEKISVADYLYYLISSSIVKDPAIKSMSGATGRQRANLDEIKQIEVPDISINNQRKIAKILSNYDDLIENNNKRIKILEEMAQKIYKEWFVDFKFPNHETATFKQTELGEIPSDWEVSTLENILSGIESGSRPKGGINPNDKEIPSIGAENILGLGKYDYSKEKYISNDFYEKMKKGKVKNLDVLLYKDGAQLGRKSIFGENFPHSKCCINEHVFILRTNQKCSPYYLYFTLDTMQNTERIKQLNTNAAQPGINQEQVKGLTIVLPQKEYIEKFDNLVNSMVSEIFKLCIKNQTLKQTRDLLLPRLISGEIDVENMEIK